MKLIINTNTLIGSGVTQVATSFLYECLSLNDSNEYHVFLGEKVENSINKELFDSRFHFYSLPIKPLAIGRGGMSAIIQMKKLESIIKPDAVFTVFGPAWWRPKAKHLQGYAHPYYIYPEGPYLKLLNVKERLKVNLLKYIYCYFLKRGGRYFVTETEFVSSRLRKLLDLQYDSVFTASNTCNSFFREFKDDKRISLLPRKNKDEFRFISLCTLQGHKNLSILNKVIPLLKQKGYSNIKFILTIEHNLLQSSFIREVRDNIVNVGRILPSDCPYLFNECDALFLPTLAECFTANYPEAMSLSKPILTSNLPFAIDVCQNAALYFDPLDEVDICDKIITIVKNENLRSEIVNNGKSVLKTFLTPRERALKYLEILNIIIKK